MGCFLIERETDTHREKDRDRERKRDFSPVVFFEVEVFSK